MRILYESYPLIVQTPRELKAKGKLLAAGVPDVPDVTVNVIQTNDRGLRVTINDINVDKAIMLFNLSTPGQPMPAISFVGESDDKNWDIKLNNISFQHVQSSGTSILEGSVQQVIARKHHSASHLRSLIGLGDIVISGFTTISMSTTMSNGSPGFSMQRVIVPLPAMMRDQKHSLCLHTVNHNLRKFIRKEKINNHPVLSVFLVEQSSVPRDPESILVSEIRSMLAFASGGSAHIVCVYHIDDSEFPYHIEFWDAPSSVCQSSFAALPLLDLPRQNYFGDFVSKSHAHWKNASDLGFDLAMHFVLDSTDNPSREIRFATLSVAFEVLASHHAAATGFSRELRDRRRGRYKSFGDLLNEICRQRGVQWNSNNFIEIRNKILHEGKLLPFATFDKYCEFINVFHQIILKTVKYSGIYNDVKTFSNGTI
jgi:hypothetical protein